MNAIVVGCTELLFTLNQLQHICSQPRILCSFLSFWRHPCRRKADCVWRTYLSVFGTRGKRRRAGLAVHSDDFSLFQIGGNAAYPAPEGSAECFGIHRRKDPAEGVVRGNAVLKL